MLKNLRHSKKRNVNFILCRLLIAIAIRFVIICLAGWACVCRKLSFFTILIEDHFENILLPQQLPKEANNYTQQWPIT